MCAQMRRQAGRQAGRQALLICLVSSHYRQVRELPENKIEPVSPGKRPEGAVPSCSIYDTTSQHHRANKQAVSRCDSSSNSSSVSAEGKEPVSLLALSTTSTPNHHHRLSAGQTNKQTAAHRVHTIKRAPATATDTDTQRLKAKKGKGKRNPTNNKIMKRKKQRVHTGNLCDTPLLQSPLSQLASPSI